MKDIELTVSKVVEFNIKLEGLTENEAGQLAQDLRFLEERLPNGLNDVARKLLQHLDTELTKRNTVSVTFPHQGI